MAKNIILGSRKAMSNGFTSKEVEKFEHITAHDVHQGSVIIPVLGTIMVRNMTVNGKSTSRSFSCVCVVRHPDKTSHAEEFSFSWLAGKESSSAPKARIERSTKSNKYYLKYEELAYNAPSLPLIEGGTDFAFRFQLKAEEEFDAYATKSFGFAFEENTSASNDEDRWINTQQILDLVAKGITEVDLTPVKRFRFTREIFSGRLSKQEETQAKRLYQSLTGVTLK